MNADPRAARGMSLPALLLAIAALAGCAGTGVPTGAADPAFWLEGSYGGFGGVSRAEVLESLRREAAGRCQGVPVTLLSEADGLPEGVGRTRRLRLQFRCAN